MRLLEESGRLEQVEPGKPSSLGEAGRFELSEGHTPGLMLAEVGGVVFCADLIPGRAWVHLPVTMGYDRWPEKLIDEKKAFLDDKIARGVKLFFTHDHGCALAAVEKDAKGRYMAVDTLERLAGHAAANRLQRLRHRSRLVHRSFRRRPSWKRIR